MIKSCLKSVILDRLIPDARYVGNTSANPNHHVTPPVSPGRDSLLPAHCYGNTYTWLVGMNNDTAITENGMEVP